jgi:class 3 adenylate cyclase
MPMAGSDQQSAARAQVMQFRAPSPRRQLAVVLSADATGFTPSMARNDEDTVAQLKACREILEITIKRHDGRLFGSFGDSLMAELASPVEAVRAALEAQTELAAANAEIPAKQRLCFRIGVYLGDVIKAGTDLFGDAVNLASRIQALALPGGIAVSAVVYEQVRSRVHLTVEDLGPKRLKGVDEPVHVLRVAAGAGDRHRAPRAAASTRRRSCLCSCRGRSRCGGDLGWRRARQPSARSTPSRPPASGGDALRRQRRRSRGKAVRRRSRRRRVNGSRSVPQL